MSKRKNGLDARPQSQLTNRVSTNRTYWSVRKKGKKEVNVFAVILFFHLLCKLVQTTVRLCKVIYRLLSSQMFVLFSFSLGFFPCLWVVHFYSHFDSESEREKESKQRRLAFCIDTVVMRLQNEFADMKSA